MNRRIGFISAAVNLAAVLGFALCMPFGWLFGCYFCSMFIAFGFVGMACAYAHYAVPERRVAGYAALAFAAMYATLILLVYFTQLTAVRTGGLTEQAAALLDFQQMGLFFSLDLLGYALMSLSTFFAGLTLCPCNRPGKWLKALLLIHGMFFFSCLLMPLLGVFQADSPAFIGILVLEVWCAYFAPVSVLSLLHFRGQAA